jgi:hypothetical protein
MEELRTKTEYQLADDPLGLPQITAQEIVNRLLVTHRQSEQFFFFRRAKSWQNQTRLACIFRPGMHAHINNGR